MRIALQTCSLLPAFALAALDLGYKSSWSDSDLTRFVTRPEIKAPLFNVTVHQQDRVQPGYWFLAPYAVISQENFPQNYYQACSTGPAIYDGSGELVWSGACAVHNQNTVDFHVTSINGSTHLTGIRKDWDPHDVRGRAVIWNSSYQEIFQIVPPGHAKIMDMHEFLYMDKTHTAIFISPRIVTVDLSDITHNLTTPYGWVVDHGFVEVNVITGEILFEWSPVDHVPLSASSREPSGLDSQGWGYFHLNSVEKTRDGDYLISSRFTDCIYLISKRDGSIIWRLGGKDSSFILDGFNFSKQHDARIHSENATTMIISFLDNAGDGAHSTSDTSTAYLISLDLIRDSAGQKTAKVLRQWTRPDGKRSDLRGNLQLLDNGNAFTSWSDNAYISEHTEDGELVLEARFRSERFVTYRAYKHDFHGSPLEPPTLRMFEHRADPVGFSLTEFYVSWNGATEVTDWRFHAYNNQTGTSTIIGTTPKNGFETTYTAAGRFDAAYVEGLAHNGDSLGRSALELAIRPNSEWTIQDSERAQAERRELVVQQLRNNILVPRSRYPRRQPQNEKSDIGSSLTNNQMPTDQEHSRIIRDGVEIPALKQDPNFHTEL